MEQDVKKGGDNARVVEANAVPMDLEDVSLDVDSDDDSEEEEPCDMADDEDTALELR